mmetsp:Transcript_77587/g.153913  ORF Transcript_77587/g.153913 Transcript_77587/m.153913 type:complete len:140 (-) Transcript_77587:218-637(-)
MADMDYLWLLKARLAGELAKCNDAKTIQRANLDCKGGKMLGPAKCIISDGLAYVVHVPSGGAESAPAIGCLAWSNETFDHGAACEWKPHTYGNTMVLNHGKLAWGAFALPAICANTALRSARHGHQKHKVMELNPIKFG